MNRDVYCRFLFARENARNMSVRHCKTFHSTLIIDLPQGWDREDLQQQSQFSNRSKFASHTELRVKITSGFGPCKFDFGQ